MKHLSKGSKLTFLLIFLSCFAICQNNSEDSIIKKKSINLNEVGFFYEPQQTWFFFLPSPGTYISKPTYKSSFGCVFGHYGKENNGLETGLIYSNQGQNYTKSQVYNYNSHYDSTTLNVFFNLSYFKIPIILRVSGNPEKKFWANINLGMQICFLNNATFKIEDTESSPYNYNQQVDLEPYLKHVDLNIVASIGFNFKIKNNFILFSGLRFDRSAFNVAKSNPYPDPPPSHSTNLGLMIGIKKILTLSSGALNKEK